jgi:hypothetical protein
MTEATPIQSVTTAHPLRVAVDAYERPQVPLKSALQAEIDQPSTGK